VRRSPGRGGRAWPSIRLAAAIGCAPWLAHLVGWIVISRDFEDFLGLLATALLFLLLPSVAVLNRERWPFAVLGLVGLPLMGVGFLAGSVAEAIFWFAATTGWTAVMCLASTVAAAGADDRQ
jgi:hypothetical protein